MEQQSDEDNLSEGLAVGRVGRPHSTVSGETQEDAVMKSQGEGGREERKGRRGGGKRRTRSATVKDITRLLRSDALKRPGNYLKVYTSGYKCGALKAPRRFFLAKTTFPCH